MTGLSFDALLATPVSRLMRDAYAGEQLLRREGSLEGELRQPTRGNLRVFTA